MVYTLMNQKALKLCFDARRDQLDKSGMPYVFNPKTYRKPLLCLPMTMPFPIKYLRAITLPENEQPKE